MNFEDLEPDKLYFGIAEVAKQFDVNRSALRFWEKEFTQLKPRKNGKGDRLYTREDVALLRYIHFLLKEKGYTIEGAKKVLKENDGKPMDTYQLIERLERVSSFLKELRKQI